MPLRSLRASARSTGGHPLRSVAGVRRGLGAVVVGVVLALGSTPAGAQVFELNPVELTGTVRIGDFTIVSLFVVATSGELGSSTPDLAPHAVEVPYETIVQVPVGGSAFYRLRIAAGLLSPDGSQFVNFLFEGDGVLVHDGVPAVIDMVLDPPSLISATVTAIPGELLETVFVEAVNADSGVVGTFSTSLDAPAGGAASLTVPLPVGPGIRLQCRGNALMTNGRTGALEPRQIVTVPDGGIDETCVFDVSPPAQIGTIPGELDLQGEVPVEQYQLSLLPRPNQPGVRQEQTLLPPFAGPGNRAEFLFEDVVEGLYSLSALATLEGGASEFGYTLSDRLTGVDGGSVISSTCQAYAESSIDFGGITAPEDYVFSNQLLVDLGGGRSSRAVVDPRDGPFRFIASAGSIWQQVSSFRIGVTQTSLRFEGFPLDCFETVTLPDRLIETGRVEIRLRLSEGDVMRFPGVEGTCELRDESGDEIYSYDVSSNNSSTAFVPVGLVFVEAPAGVCDFSASATIGGIRVSFGSLNDVEIEPGADIVIEIGAPRIEIASPAAGQMVEAAEILVTGTATDDVEVASVEVNGVLAELTPTGNPADPNEVGFVATVPLVFGSNVIEAVATDDAGSTDAVSVTIQNTLEPVGDDPPSIVITIPTAGERFDPFTPIPIEGVASDDVEVVSVVTTGGEAPLVPTGNPDDPNEVAYARTVTVFGTGLFTLTATARDDAGQTTSTSVEVLIAPPPIPCDVDGDSVIDATDIDEIFAARGSEASGPDDPRDPNRDGLITINDARACVLDCDLPECATPLACGLLGVETLLPVAWLLRRRRGGPTAHPDLGGRR